MTCSLENNQGAALFLADNIQLLPFGKALDIAMGKGRNAVYLAAKGWQVEGVDNNPDRVLYASRLAREAGANINARVADLEKGGFKIEPACWDVIICFYYLQRSLMPHITAGLKPGGVVVYETFIIDQMAIGRPNNPDYLLRHNELLELFRDLRCLRYREGFIVPDKAIASIVAQKPE